MFPSPEAPTKKLHPWGKKCVHVLAFSLLNHNIQKQCELFLLSYLFFSLCLCQSAEDPNTFLQARPLFSPVVIVCKTNCNLGTMPVVTFPKENIYASVTYLMACYYAFHLTYPKCIATLFSVLQTQVLSDAIHDMTSSYKKAMAEWKKLITD